MKTIHSHTFEARRYVPEENIGGPNLPVMIAPYALTDWVMSAGRWDSHLEATANAAEWLNRQAVIEPQQYEIRLIQVEELDLNHG